MAAAVAVLLPAVGDTRAADWPAHRADAGRSGHGRAEHEFPLTRAWVHRARPPVPAWGPPARRSYWQRLEHLEARVTDDHAFAPVIAGDAVYFGSSADDQVRCLAAATGSVRWSFRTDGPVRFAPAVADGRVYFGSDDGWLYAVAAADGTLVWRRRPGPEDTRLPGNGRLISAWPVRTGVLVEGDTLYATAGLYPQQGAFACALDVVTGTPRWQVTMTDSPDGYLLATARLLIVPTGRASPVGLDRATGQRVREFDTGGGTYAVVAGDEMFGGPGNDATLTGVGTQSGQRLIAVKGRNLVATEGKLYLVENGTLKAIDRSRQAAIGREAKELEARLRPLQERQRRAGTNGLPDADRAELQRLREGLASAARRMDDCVLWQVPCPEHLALIGTGGTLIAGGTNAVAAFDRATGRRLWKATTEGRALALAAADGCLAVGTDRGGIEWFASAPGVGTARAEADAPGSSPASPDLPAAGPMAEPGLFARLRAAGLSRRGYAVVAGLGSGGWIDALIRRTELHVVAIDSDPATVARVRREHEARGTYGTRISVHAVPSGPLPFVDGFANALISEAGLEGRPALAWPVAQLERLVRPFGGVRWIDAGTPPVARPPLEGAGEWTHQFGNPANTASSGDRRIRAGLALQWFGGPGPDVMVDRHLRAPAPLAGGGRLFVPGENRLLAVDAFNGTELWQRELPGSQRYSMPYDAGYLSLHGERLAVAVRDQCWILRASEGDVVSRFDLPTAPAAAPPSAGAGADADANGSGNRNGNVGRGAHWGWVALVPEGLFGSSQRSTASRTTPGYDQIDQDYNNHQPLVTGHTVFRVDPESGTPTWQRRGGPVLNTTLTLHRGRVLFVEARSAALAGHPTGRIPLSELLEGDPWLVALEAGTGRVAWERPLAGEIVGAGSILYLVGAGERLVLLGSRVGEGNDTGYLVECRSASDGGVLWTGRHAAGQPGAFTHGEQVHHPVVLDDLLVAEPCVYDLESGRRRSAAGTSGDWRLIRPGHSCGTLSGAGDCLFFRANNPTVLDLRASLESAEPPRKLAPSRTGCWINMIPANGLLLVPEASAGCVCQYSLQTSMAFRPR